MFTTKLVLSPSGAVRRGDHKITSGRDCPARRSPRIRDDVRMHSSRAQLRAWPVPLAIAASSTTPSPSSAETISTRFLAG